MDLQEGIDNLHRQGLFNEEFYQKRLTYFEFRQPENLPQAKTLIIVSIPQPQIKETFIFHGEPHNVIVPPTYAYNEDTQVLEILSSVLRPHGYGVVRSKLPLKSLAVHSGLGSYGRNNICYVPGLGSFHRLAAFYTDFEAHEDNWQDFRIMERCSRCQACLRSCPTGAINEERFLVHAERCITFRNERPTKFPTWLDKSWHNCLVGCLRCQKVCPENAPFVNWIVGDKVFSEEETTIILKGIAEDRLPVETLRKIERLNLSGAMDILPRNLGVLLR
jgi:epoxyqueuosine reductase